jgi:hypothetical protein
MLLDSNYGFQVIRTFVYFGLESIYLLLSISALLILCLLLKCLLQTLFHPRTSVDGFSVLPRTLHSSFGGPHGLASRVRRAIRERSTIVQSLLHSCGQVQPPPAFSEERDDCAGGMLLRFVWEPENREKIVIWEEKKHPHVCSEPYSTCSNPAISFDEDLGILSYDPLNQSRKKETSGIAGI